MEKLLVIPLVLGICIIVLQYIILLMTIFDDDLDDLKIKTKKDLIIWMIPLFGILRYVYRLVKEQLKNLEK